MSRLRTLLLLILALDTLAGCSRNSPVAPALQNQSAELTEIPTFLITSAADSRLPVPGEEAAATTPGDRWLAARVTPASASSDPIPTNSVCVWNRLAGELGSAAKLPPPMLARDYALLHVAIYDALVAGQWARRGHLADRVVAAGAASELLGNLFPAAADRIAATLATELALVSDSPHRVLRALALGRAVGRIAVWRGHHDGSDAVYAGTPPSGDGIWVGSNPVLPMCGTWRTWITSSGAEFQPQPPYPFGSAADLREVQEVLDVSLQRTPEQVVIVHKWADQSPPTIWCSMLNDRIEAQHLDTFAAARAQAFLNVAVADAFISCWRSKYGYWVARPFQRIPGLVTVIPTPNFPTYTSGHSTISAAAAEVMATVFPNEHGYFEAQAEEAAMSRLWGGIHFRHDNDEGLFVGRHIGRRAADIMQGRRRHGSLASAASPSGAFW